MIREKVGVAPIEDNIRVITLRWFGHIKRRNVNAPIKMSETINLLGFSRGRGRSKKKLG